MLIKSTVFILFITLGVIAQNNRTLRQECDPYDLPINCGTNQGCIGNRNRIFTCNCLQDYIESDGDCVKISSTAAASVDLINHKTEEKPSSSSPSSSSSSSSSGSSVAAGLLIPTFLIIFGGIGFCCAKKYKLLSCRSNVYGNVLVTREEDDDDDPPIA